jgi:excisionase family DNA binding protein
MSQPTTLKAAVLWCCRLAIPWSAQDVAAMANLDPNAVKAYLSRLASENVVVRAEDGSYRAGDPAAIKRMRSTPTDAKPGGGGAAYRRGKAARDRLLTMEAIARRKNELLTSQTMTNPSTKGQAQQADFSSGALTCAQVASMLNVSPMTVYRYTKQGRLPMGRLPGGHTRYGLADVQRFIHSITSGVAT